jgi:hypothetical protein
MELPPRAKAHFAERRMDSAARSMTAIANKQSEDSEENRRSYERFYNNLALFSGGTVALSVTYLGYLKTLSKPILHERWLLGSWGTLFICLACSLFWSFFMTHYGHYYRNREYCEAAKERYETEVREVVHLDLVNVQTPEELAAYRNPRIEAAATSEKNARWNEIREKRYERLWIWTGRLARAGFLVGLGFLLSFAVANI